MLKKIQHVWFFCRIGWCEVAAVKVKLGKACIFLVVIYRNQGNTEVSLEIISQVLESIPTDKSVNIDSLKKINTIPKWEVYEANITFRDWISHQQE